MADDNDTAERRRRTSPGMGGISTLPEHLQHEVFSRVGNVNALFKFAATCRGWLDHFTDYAFLRKLCPSHPMRLLGVFVQDKWFIPCYKQAMVQAPAPPPPPQRASSTAPVFLPVLGSPLGSAGRALTSFTGGDDDDGTLGSAKILAARRGILLLRLAPRTPEEMGNCHLFGVRNPITGDRHILQPMKCSRRTLVGRTVTGYAIITAADDDSGGNGTPSPAAARWTFSQLLVITQLDGGDSSYVLSYSAAMRRWSAPTMCLDYSCGFSLVPGAKSAVVHRGAAHWLCIKKSPSNGGEVYRLSVEVATASISLTRIPVRVGGEQLLCVTSEGKLAVVSVYPMHVTVWTPPDGAGAGAGDDDTPVAAWPRTSFRITPRQHHEKRWWSFNHGSLLALFWGDEGMSSGGVFFILDLDTKVIEEVFNLDLDNEAATGFLAGSHLRHLTCVPYEMDLVEFFTLQLCGIRERLSGTTTTSETESP